MKAFKFLFLTVLTTALFVSCSDDDDTKSDGDKFAQYQEKYNEAKKSLILHFPFEGDAKEVVGNRAATATDAVTYKDGWIGKYYQGAEGAHIKSTIEEADELNKLTSFTYTLWMKLPVNWEGGAGMVFSLNDESDFWGSLCYFNDYYGEQDTVMVKTFFLDNEATTWKGQWVEVKQPFTKEKWTQVAVTYDEKTSLFSYYINGKALIQDIRTDGPAVDAAGKEIVMEEGDSYTKEEAATNKLGALKFLTNKYFLIGQFRQKAVEGAGDDWMKNFTGSIDELKVYKTALTEEEVTAAFNVELQSAE